ncbi:MAG: aspartyl aminopeptidase [Candidatus Poriferisodalaceae bacterium]|jgi:aspartyl aminopeptidase
MAPVDPSITDRLFSYIDGSPSPYHAAANAEMLLAAAGWQALDEGDDWSDVRGKHVVRRGGALVAFDLGDIDPGAIEFRIIGAHTDSPNLRIKPHPDVQSAGYRQLGVEVYGGPLLNSWLDRDLGVSGRAVVSTDDGEETMLFKVNEPMLRVTQLAIHLDRDVNDGLKLDRQRHLAPIWGLGSADVGGFARWLTTHLNVTENQLVSWDAMVHDLTPSTRIGQDGAMYAAPRIDNLTSTHASIEGLLSAAGADVTAAENVVPVMVLFDHEEIGSASSTGAGSPLLANTLERLVGAVGGGREALHRSVSRSWCVSADGAHAVHPNYIERHEPNHQVQLNEGPVVKVNANVRYASDAETVARFAAACASAGVPMQRYAHRTDLACGSTIGPITASNLGMRVVDVGCAQLSMHSARELGGSDDPSHLAKSLAAFLAGA